jgi:hypothetical protein
MTPSGPEPWGGFELRPSQEQAILRDTVRRFAVDQLMPLRSSSRPHVDRKAARKAAAELDVHSLVFDASGGSQSAGLSLALVAEELGSGDLEAAADIVIPLLASLLLSRCDGCDGKAAPERPNAPAGGAWALGILKPIRSGRAYVLGRGTASHALFLRRTFDWRRGHEIQLLRADRPALENAGIRPHPNMGMQELWLLSGDQPACECLQTFALTEPTDFDGVFVQGLLGIFAAITGAMRSAVADAYSYAAGRRTFGKPIIAHQVVAIRLADMLTEYEATKLLLWSAASDLDRGTITRDAVHVMFCAGRESGTAVFRDAIPGNPDVGETFESRLCS